MHDATTLLRAETRARQKLARRRFDLDTESLAALRSRRSDLTGELDKLRAEAKVRSKAASSADPDAAAAERTTGRELKKRIQELESVRRAADEELTRFLLQVPNLPADEAPDGDADEDAELVRVVGEPGPRDFAVMHHADYGERTGLIDMPRAAKLSGARFSVTTGALAALQRALAAFLLDLHTLEHGYQEYTVPTLVSRPTMTGTGQLPKFEEDLFRTRLGERELFLIPTAEVPLTNLYAGEILPAAALPIAMTARTTCFRAEAGSHGKDTRGVFRVHEFEKVELVRLCHPADSAAQLQLLLEHAESCLQQLGLAYRVVRLAAGDLGFSARLTYDIEVWLPSQQRYREISSCSDCGQFQARRANIKVRSGDSTDYLVTLNGSALPLGRTMIALIEQHQQADGSVVIPEALAVYTGFDRILPDGGVVARGRRRLEPDTFVSALNQV